MTSPYVCILKSLPFKADCSVASGGTFFQCQGHSATCLLQMHEETEKFGICSLFLFLFFLAIIQLSVIIIRKQEGSFVTQQQQQQLKQLHQLQLSHRSWQFPEVSHITEAGQLTHFPCTRQKNVEEEEEEDRCSKCNRRFLFVCLIVSQSVGRVDCLFAFLLHLLLPSICC